MLFNLIFISSSILLTFASSDGCPYTVKSGDNPSSVATMCGTTVQKLSSMNPTIKDPKNIPVGITVMVPCSCLARMSPSPSSIGSYKSPSSSDGGSYKSSSGNDPSATTSVVPNTMPTAMPTPMVSPSSVPQCQQKVMKNDTFAKLSSACGLDTSGQALVILNPDKVSTLLQPGDTINIPCKCKKGNGKMKMCRKVSSGSPSSASGQESASGSAQGSSTGAGQGSASGSAQGSLAGAGSGQFRL